MLGAPVLEKLGPEPSPKPGLASGQFLMMTEPEHIPVSGLADHLLHDVNQHLNLSEPSFLHQQNDDTNSICPMRFMRCQAPGTARRLINGRDVFSMFKQQWTQTWSLYGMGGDTLFV